jgi:hypothetical protein
LAAINESVHWVYTDGAVLLNFAADDNGESNVRRSSTLVNRCRPWSL